MTSCPHCQTALADPFAARCPSCGGALSPLTPDEVKGALGSPAPEPAAVHPGPVPGGIPWDQRDRIGFAAAFVETTRQVLTAPTSFYSRMPVTGGLGSPLLYAVISGWLGLAAAAFYQAIWVSIVGPAALPFGLDRGELSEALRFFESWAGLVAQVVFGGISVVISVFVGSGIVHLMLLLLGGARRGFEATFRVVCYAEATALLLLIPLFLIPFCGILVAVWCLVLCVIGLAIAHGTERWRALVALLLPIVLVCCCCAGLALTFAGAIAGFARGMP